MFQRILSRQPPARDSYVLEWAAMIPLILELFFTLLWKVVPRLGYESASQDLLGSIFHVRLVLVRRYHFHLALPYRHQVTCETDPHKNRPE